MSNEEKLRLLIRRFGPTQTAFAAQLHVSVETLRCWIKRDCITNRALSLIINTFPLVNPAWIMYDKEPMCFESRARLMTGIRATAGRGEQFDDMAAASRPFHVPGVQADDYIPVKGNSMEPTIYEGDYIGVKSITSLDLCPSTKTIYLVVTQEGERMVKHIAEETMDTITLTSDNPAYEPFVLDKVDIRKVFKVVYIVRNDA